MVILFVIGMILPSIAAYIFSKSVVVAHTTLDGAKEALVHIQEWAKWVSGIQTLTIAGLAWLFVDEDRKITLHGYESLFAALAFCCLGIALFVSAWILSSVPSLSLRIHEDGKNRFDSQYDVYEQTMWGRGGLRLGTLLTLNHWYWGWSLLSFGTIVFLKYIC